MTIRNDVEAHCLAITYGLLPEVKCHATGGSQVVEGKYEPDHSLTPAKRCMVLAHWFDHTNIIVQYSPILNLYVPFYAQGELEPDATGNYAVESEYNDEFTYVAPERKFFLWWDGIDSWLISDAVGWLEGPYWKRTDPDIIGDYEPFGGAVGTATIFKRLE